MFGGYGFYCDEVFFAIFAHEMLFLKADAESVESFRQAGGEPFCFTYKDGRTETTSYWSIPEEALENPEAMRPWGKLALAAAIRGRKRAKKLAGPNRQSAL